jgi:thymidine phosphorylase
MRTPPTSKFRKILSAGSDGVVEAIDNRRIARLAKLAGAPQDKAAGIDLHVRLGDTVGQGAPLFTLHAEADGELAYALNYADANADIIRITEP